MPRKPIAPWLRVLILSPLLIFFFWALSDLIYVASGNERDDAAPAEAIIVLGCPSYEQNVVAAHFSACIQARAHHAASLYKRGLAPAVIPTGGMTGPPPSEAAALAQLMMADGVPESAIFVEDQAHDTIQNIQYSRAIMQQHDWKTAILVTEPNHIKRAMLIARDGGLSVVASPVTNSAGWNTPSARTQNLWADAHALMTYQIRRLFGLVV